jgi:serine/threonine-protein kinase
VVLGELGEGGMGSVYKARHQRMGRTVCLKVLHSSARRTPQLVERFRREAKTVAALSHPNIVAAHDAAEEDGVPFLVMEYIEGQDLSQYVREHGPLPVDTAIEIVLQTALALDYAHAQGVVHRDIKPANLILAVGQALTTDSRQPIADRPAVKILDMGLARFDSFLADDLENSTSQTMTAMGVVMGTVDYMSPEQALNSRTADARSDIYSLGCTLFYLLTGRAMFGGDTAMERIVAHREHAPPMLLQLRHDVPFELHAVFLNMVAKRPEERYQSMGEVARDLELVLTGNSPSAVARSQPLLDAPPLLVRQRDRTFETFKWMMIVAAILGIVALGAWLVISTDWQNLLREERRSMYDVRHGLACVVGFASDATPKETFEFTKPIPDLSRQSRSRNFL